MGFGLLRDDFRKGAQDEPGGQRGFDTKIPAESRHCGYCALISTARRTPFLF